VKKLANTPVDSKSLVFNKIDARAAFRMYYLRSTVLDELENHRNETQKSWEDTHNAAGCHAPPGKGKSFVLSKISSKL